MKKSEVRKLAAQYPKYVRWSDEDHCFIGECPVIFSGGIIGKDEAKVYKELCQTVEEWIEIMNHDGIPLPKVPSVREFSGKFLVRIDPFLHQRLALKANAEGESLNSFVEKALLKA
jgi:predicted HicB family RNase H-like nuclease